ncbi:SMI1/KNR4 family protein [Massilia sp. P8910]|uniref:SMI1/KNR4 family protein n=1 Tax=Massilia antarctica TaxID=2765360 RepID=UPI001E53362F|nr:SMI1/KNR4 family protein [Massilia antarctica]MCE3602570.1 SMI1/KNR4 family protein [Massilia antarctica]
MSILGQLIKLLIPFVKDAVPLDEAEIRQFAEENNVSLRDDHVDFLMKLGRAENGRLAIFHRYGGDFDFENLEDTYLENHPDLMLPSESTYFGTNFVGDSFCIDCSSGKIYLYSAGKRCGLVHGTIEGFLLECLLPVYNHQVFCSIISKKNLSKEDINEFRLVNEKNKLADATRYVLEYENIDDEGIFAEHFFIDGHLISMYPTVGSLITMSGGILNELKL